MAKRRGDIEKVKGDVIRQLRAQKGWSQDDLAGKTGYSKRLIQKMEAGGTAKLATIKEFAQALGVEHTTLIQGLTAIEVENIGNKDKSDNLIAALDYSTNISLTRQTPRVSASVTLFDRRKMDDDYYTPIEKGLSSEFGWPPGRIHIASFVLRELMNNGFEHGCRGVGELEVSFTAQVEQDGNLLILTVGSPGEGFDITRVIWEGLLYGRDLDFDRPRGKGLIYISRIAQNLIVSADGRVIQASIYRDSGQAHPTELRATVLTVDGRNIAVVSLPRELCIDNRYILDKEQISQTIEGYNIIGGIIDMTILERFDSPSSAIIPRAGQQFGRRNIRHIYVMNEIVGEFFRIVRIGYPRCTSMEEAVKYLIEST